MGPKSVTNRWCGKTSCDEELGFTDEESFVEEESDLEPLEEEDDLIEDMIDEE